MEINLDRLNLIDDGLLILSSYDYMEILKNPGNDAIHPGKNAMS